MDSRHFSNEKAVQILVALLKEHGIKKVIASPGTTNISFVATIMHDPFFEIYSSVDERSAAYIACGLSVESGEPVVISCTGATASRNYMPGLTEAYYRKIPVLAVTSSQPQCNMGHLKAQAIDRNATPNDIVNLSVKLPIVKDDNDEWECVINANKAILELKRNGGGPVHINLETTYSRDFSVTEIPSARAIYRYGYEDELPEMPNGKIAVRIGNHKPFSNEEINAIDRFCAKYNAIVLGDHTSNYNGRYKINSVILGAFDAFDLDVDLAIHIGDVSGDNYTKSKARKVWRVNPDGEIRDTFRKLTAVFQMSELFFFKSYGEGGGSNTSFVDAAKRVQESIYSSLPELPFSNVYVASELSKLVPMSSVLHFGILNSLRSWNLFEIPTSVEAFSNTGGFGIDGCVSSLIGGALAQPDKLHFGFVGDLAFFYDLNSIGNRHISNNIRIVVVNNGRGTEFTNYYNVGASFGEETDKFISAAGHFGFKSKTLIKNLAESLGFEYLSASDMETLKSVSPIFMTPKKGQKPIILEIFTDSKNESDAIKLMTHDSAATSLKKVVGGILGEKGKSKVKNIFNKIK